MPDRSAGPRGWLAILSVSIPLVVIFVSVLTVPLEAARSMGLTAQQTSGWIMVLYGLTGAAAFALSLQQRQPLMLTGNIFALIFIASLGDQLAYEELVGGFVVAGLAVLVVSALGITPHLSKWIPAPVVYGVLAGAVAPFVFRLFTAVGTAPLLVGGTVLVYFLTRRFLAPRVPAILGALLTGGVLLVVTGQIGPAPAGIGIPTPVLIEPHFNWAAVVTVAPVITLLVTLQANMPSLIYLRGEGYQPPSRGVDLISGVGTMLGSLLGPMAMSLSLPSTALLGGEQAGERPGRYRGALVAGAAAVLIGALATAAAQLGELIPGALLSAFAGLAVLDILISALEKVTARPLILGPVAAFAISLSELSLFGLGPFFWALALGTAIAHLVEQGKLTELQEVSEVDPEEAG